MLVNLKDVLIPAQKGGYAVGLFNTTDTDMLEGVLAAAEELRAPVIIGTAEVLLPFGELKLIAPSVRAAAERAAKAAENSDNVFFTIGSTVIRKAEAEKIEKLAAWMKANPDFTVTLVGYADKETGTPKGNMKLSEGRVEKVKAMLVKLGVEPSRVDFKGDTVQPFAENAKNRVVTCTLE